MAEQNEGKEGCCSEKGCGCGRQKKCCGGKGLGLLALILVAGVIGYLIGMGKMHCGHMMTTCPFSSMGTPAPAPGK